MHQLSGLLIGLTVFTLSACASFPRSDSTYTPLVNFGTRLKTNDVILHGTGQDAAVGHVPTGFTAYPKAISDELAPTMFMTYVGFSQIPAQFLA
jgi:hypothetical protein